MEKAVDALLIKGIDLALQDRVACLFDYTI